MMQLVRWTCLGALLLVPLTAKAQPPAVVPYCPPAPVVSYYAPAPVVSYYAAPVVTYAAPAVVAYEPTVSVTRYRYGVLGLRKLDVVNYGAAPVVTPVRSYYYVPRTVVVP
jgi:hypothetical protein